MPNRHASFLKPVDQFSVNEERLNQLTGCLFYWDFRQWGNNYEVLRTGRKCRISCGLLTTPVLYSGQTIKRYRISAKRDTWYNTQLLWNDT